MWRITGYSSVIPLAPRIVRASRAISSASRTLLSLPMLTCCGASRPSSFIRPRCSASSVPLLSSTIMSTSLRWVSWNPPIGLPHWTRVFAYSSADSKHARAAPIEPHTMPNRASVRHDSGPLSPETPGSTASAGRRTSSRTSSEVTLARSESLRCMSFAENPGVSVGTTNPRIPSSVRAHTIATSATLPLVIHIFVPVRTQSSPSRRALVRMRPRVRAARRARSGRSSRSPRPWPSGAATAASAPRSRTSRSGTCRATPGRSRTTGTRCPRPRAPGRPGRSSRRSSPRSS